MCLYIIHVPYNSLYYVEIINILLLFTNYFLKFLRSEMGIIFYELQSLSQCFTQSRCLINICLIELITDI